MGDAAMNLQRKLTLMVTTGAIALGAGHFVQERAAERSAQVEADLGPAVVVSSVVPVAAGPTDVPAVRAAVMLQIVAVAPEPAPEPAPAPAPAVAEPESVDCRVQFDAIAQPGAMVGLTLLAPCQPDQRVVLKHAGLAITARTSASGALFTVLPGLSAVADVQVAFANGESATASAALSDFENMRRFAVQW
jgi:hypothetical protein